MAILSRALVATFVAGLAGVSAAESGCRVRNSEGRCLGSEALDEDGFASLLQRASSAQAKVKADARQEPEAAQNATAFNSTALWHQITGAVQIEDLQKRLQQVQDSEQVQKLQKHLQDLQAEFPDAETIKQKFSDQWTQVSEAVNLETVSAALDKAKADHSDKLDALQRKYDELRAALPNVTLEGAQAKATQAWAHLQDQGVPLPNLDDLEAQAQDAFEKAKTSAAAALDDLQDAAAGALDAAKAALGNFWR
eukprot:CAMPEP_0176225682 /NCGR_PEP_ID=MMETSP0121_2-20121125/21881_1 /TAXON_ID=160619 /ORGANISM="Kryptoperidinium foliaceum, Strain CCMP 1326" /LENGTH=251 /DNA_ID=CAMNT_0017564945 /DNA_START=79 /DNA_END=834 /DNA_ORIENTATION=-